MTADTLDTDLESLRPSARYVLDELKAAHAPLTQEELTERTYYARNTVSVAVNDLVDLGFVERVDAPSNGQGRTPSRYRVHPEHRR